MSETTEIRDWHARRAGWEELSHDADGNATAWINETYASCGVVLMHPFPPTIDGAASALPPNWSWTIERDYDASCSETAGMVWAAWSNTAKTYKEVTTPRTKDEIADRYLLAKLAWEQDHALAAACKEVGE
jgi:hypothetical protein